jgi:hypothetical protein
MSIRNIVLAVCFISIAGFSHAGIIKGNLGPDKFRAISITTGDSTFLPVEVMNDNAGSDFDLFIVDDNDDVLCSSISTIRQVEKLQCGLPADSTFSVLVRNFEGRGSVFRLYIGDEISAINSGIRPHSAFGENEISIRDLPPKLRDQINRLSSRKK